jgi:hypothetical protein
LSKIGYLWLDRKYLVNRRIEKLNIWVAWRLPKEVVKWCFFRVGANATTGEYGKTDPSSMLFMDAAKRWPAE